MRAARDAEAQYPDAKKGAKGAVKRYFRLAGDYSSAVTPWIGLLPNDKYFSTLCGGLKLIFAVRVPPAEQRPFFQLSALIFVGRRSEKRETNVDSRHI